MHIREFSTSMWGWYEIYRMAGQDATWEVLFQDCTDAGLDAVEVDADPDVVALTTRFGLSISSPYIGLNLHESWDTLRVHETVLPVAERLAEVGGTEILVNADPKDGWVNPQLKTEDEFRRQGENLARIAELVRPFGIRVAMHNHAATLPAAEGDLRSVVEYSSEAVGLCVDTGWTHVAGCNPSDWVRKYPERIYAVHLRYQVGTVPTEDLLEGEVDVPDFIQALKDINYSGWLSLELWHREDTFAKRTFIEDTRRSIQYPKELVRG
jgi:inosose dehydratase